MRIRDYTSTVLRAVFLLAATDSIGHISGGRERHQKLEAHISHVPVSMNHQHLWRQSDAQTLPMKAKAMDDVIWGVRVWLYIPGKVDPHYNAKTKEHHDLCGGCVM